MTDLFNTLIILMWIFMVAFLIVGTASIVMNKKSKKTNLILFTAILASLTAVVIILRFVIAIDMKINDPSIIMLAIVWIVTAIVQFKRYVNAVSYR